MAVRIFGQGENANHSRKIGTSTATGVDCMSTITGVVARSTNWECAIQVATKRAAKKAMTNPQNASCTVTQPFCA